MRLELPWPPYGLSPNDSVHHMTRHRARKKYGDAVHWIALAAGAVRLKRERLALKVTFCPPPAARRIDLDNTIGRFKAGQDALGKLFGIDDSKFDPVYSFGPKVKRGAVIIDIEEEQPCPS